MSALLRYLISRDTETWMPTNRKPDWRGLQVPMAVLLLMGSPQENQVDRQPDGPLPPVLHV